MKIYRGNDNINFTRIIFKIINSSVNECQRLLDRIVGFPIATNQELIPGEELLSEQSSHHNF